MKVLKIMIVMLVLIMSVGAVCAADDISDEIISDGGQEEVYTTSENSFTNLAEKIENAGAVLDLNQDLILLNLK